MTGKAKGGLVFLAFAIGAPPIVWMLARPDPPIDFLDARPDVKCLAREEFEGQPWIDWKAPGGNRFTFPTKRALADGKPDSALAGYLQLPPDRTGRVPFSASDFIAIGGENVYLPVNFIPNPSAPKPVAPRPLSASTTASFVIVSSGGLSADTMLRGIPYATDEKYRDATLHHEGQNYPVRLKVSTAFGPSIRRTETFKAGRWTVTAKPRPWMLTTQDMRFDLTSDAPPGVKLVFVPKWKEDRRSPTWAFFRPTPYVIDSGRPAPTLFLPRWQPTTEFSGEIVELEEFPIKLRCEIGLSGRKKKEFRLFYENGDLAYFQNSGQGMRRQGLWMMDVRGRRIIADHYGSAADGKPVRFSQIKDGEIVDAVGYRAKRKTPVEGTFDAPPRFKERRQFVYTSASRGHYILFGSGP